MATTTRMIIIEHPLKTPKRARSKCRCNRGLAVASFSRPVRLDAALRTTTKTGLKMMKTWASTLTTRRKTTLPSCCLGGSVKAQGPLKERDD